MQCRMGCGACCIAPSIALPLPGMPNGKLAGERCANLSADNLCQLFGKPERPDFCAAFQAHESICGASMDEALSILQCLELETRPVEKEKKP